jgi:hypothetical protein
MANIKYKELFYKGTTITEKHLIEEVLVKEGMAWFIDAEMYNARIEIENKTLIFNGGTWYNGVWKFGAWRGGEWKYGIWEDGVWFNGVWKDGKFENGIIFNGTFFQGDFMNIKIRTKNQDGSMTKQDFIDCELSQNVKKI